MWFNENLVRNDCVNQIYKYIPHQWNNTTYLSRTYNLQRQSNPIYEILYFRILPFGSVRKSMWHEYLSMDMFAFSSKCGALMFFALTVTLYTVLAARPVQMLQDI